jgi:hypothetical protein
MDTSKWRIRTSEHPAVYHELRSLLTSSGAHVQDLAMIFDEDVSSKLSIDGLEFVKIMKKWGFRGMPHVLDEVRRPAPSRDPCSRPKTTYACRNHASAVMRAQTFAAINVSGSGKIDYDECMSRGSCASLFRRR